MTYMSIGDLAATPSSALERLLGDAVGAKLSALAHNEDPRIRRNAIQTPRIERIADDARMDAVFWLKRRAQGRHRVASRHY